MSEDAPANIPTKGQGKQTPWREDPIILKRLVDVERRHLAGERNVEIAGALSVSPATVKTDLRRLGQLWLEATKEKVELLRAAKIRELDDIKRRALDAYQWDLDAERAVLYGEGPDGEPLPGGSVANRDDDGKLVFTDVPGRRVLRDDKGRAEYRGQKAQSLNVARQAVMDAAKLLGLVVDKVAPTDDQGKSLDLASLMQLARHEPAVPAEPSDGRG